MRKDEGQGDLPCPLGRQGLRANARSELELDELDDRELDDELDEELRELLELDDELLEDGLLLDELDEGEALGDGELEEGVGPVVESPHPPSIPTPASAAPPERILRNSRRSSRRFESSPAGSGFL